MAATAKLARQIGALATKSGGGWYGPHMAAASRAIAERLPLVDLVLEIRDARVPFSSPLISLFSVSLVCIVHQLFDKMSAYACTCISMFHFSLCGCTCFSIWVWVS